MFNVITSPECPYANEIGAFIKSAFPHSSIKNCSDVLDFVTAAVIATGSIRNGARPGVDAEFAIRRVIEQAISQNQPIPILVPWGSEKPKDNEGVDLAEVYALRTLNSLQERVKEVYTPGVDIRIRVEDLSALHLFESNREQALANLMGYVPHFASLVSIFDLPFIDIYSEMQQGVSELDFLVKAKPIEEVMFDYLNETDLYGLEGYESRSSYKALLSMGWQGMVPVEQRDYYRKTSFFTGYTDEEATRNLAKYLAGALVRVHLNLKGDRPEWGGKFITLGFTPPVPGEPKGRATRVHYRTVPEKITSMHIAPWRGKGYLKMTETGTRLGLVSWATEMEFTRNFVTLSNGDNSVAVRADYVIV